MRWAYTLTGKAAGCQGLFIVSDWYFVMPFCVDIHGWYTYAL